MKKNILRLSVLAFSVIYLSYSLLWSFCVPVYASALPELPPNFNDNFTIIEGMPNSSSQYSGLPSIAVEAALMKIAEPGGAYEGLVAHEELALRMASDFVKEYGDDAFRIAIAQPAEAVKQVFWNYPNQAVEACLNATNAGMIIIADEYVSFSDALLNKLKSFAENHIKNGIYYTHPIDTDISRINKIGDIGSTYSYSGREINTNTNKSNTAKSYATNANGYTIVCYPVMGVKHYKDYSLYNIYKLSFKNVNGFWQFMQFSIWDTINLVDLFSCDMPVFDVDKMSIYGQEDSFGIFKDALNWDSIDPNNIVTPVTNPIPIECPDIYHLPELYPLPKSVPTPSLDPSVEPDKDPDGYPIIEPDPIPVPIPSPVPVPDPYPNPDPTPDPDDPDPNPVGPDPDDPDPDPVDPKPDPDDPDPDPDDPNPDPDDPDPDPEPRFEWPDDSGGNPLMDLSEFFPFCLPMDLYLALHMLSADNAQEYYSYAASIDGNVLETNKPVDNPVVFDIPMTFHLSGVNQQDYTETFVIDIIQPAGEGSGSAEPYVKYLRFFLVFIYIIFLIFVSVKITPH